MSSALALPETEQKRLFAEQLLRLNDPMRAAIAIFGEREGMRCFTISQTWPIDTEVKQLTKDLVEEHGLEHFLPTKVEVAKGIVEIVQRYSENPDLKLRAYKQYAELMDFMPKPATAAINLNVGVGVMVIRDHGSDGDWETKARAQQAKLIEDATSTTT